MKNNGTTSLSRRVLALLLALILVGTSLPVTTFAEVSEALESFTETAGDTAEAPDSTEEESFSLEEENPLYGDRSAAQPPEDEIGSFTLEEENPLYAREGGGSSAARPSLPPRPGEDELPEFPEPVLRVGFTTLDLTDEKAAAEGDLERLRLDPVDTRTVLEAYSVLDTHAFDYISVTLETLPETASWESLSLYGLDAEGKLSDNPLRTALGEGDNVLIPAAFFPGFALVSEAELTALTLAPETPDGGSTAVFDGLMPEGAEVSLKPVRYAPAEGETVLLAWDITVAADGEAFQPNEARPITVTVTSDAIADARARGRMPLVLHFTKSGVEEIMPTAVEGDTLTFEAPGFSVYVITDGVYLRTYRFFSFDEYGDYTEYAFETDTGETAFTQTIREGETLVVPSDPVNPQDPNAVFAGWYQDETPPGQTNLILADKPYDFAHIPEITQTEEVRLYARFDTYVFVVLHDQYDSASGAYPVSRTIRAQVSGGSAEVDVSPYSVTCNSGKDMVFAGWSRTPVRTPGAVLDDDYHTVTTVGGSVTVSGTTHLYPVFRAVRWLSFHSGPTGSGATYYPETYYYDGNGPETLSDRIPTRDGSYTFNGWYTQDNGAGVKIANADGSLVEGASAAGISVENGAIKLSADVTLYASWSESTEANYTVVVVKQRATDAPGTADADKTYEYAESWVLSGTIGAAVSADAVYTDLAADASYNSLHPGADVEGESNPYHGYVYNAANSTVSDTVAADGSTVLYVRYDWTAQPDMTGRTFTLTFADSKDAAGETSPDLPVAYDQESGEYASVPYGAALAGYVPDNPVSGVPDGYEFTGWYADKACTTRAFFEEDSEYASYSGSKALFTTMPGADMTFYAGWEDAWYVVTIDPNYGAMYSYNGSHELEGTGSTWFWSAYGEKIQEYTTITRDYVESASGTYYYVHHTGNGYGSSEWSDRRTYYTTDPDEATEFTTFAYEPGVYRYEGWYEVLPDGTEVPYDFNSIVDHYITLRLRWTKVGAFYLSYDAGDGTLVGDSALESVYTELDGDSYADNASVVITRTATAPEGYEFTGWRVRGDESGAVYRPGDAFTLLSSYAATVQGKKTVFLDAVYARVPIVTIVYDANGGTVSDPVDYGRPAAPGAPTTKTSHTASTATIGNLVNNSRIYLSDGTGFSRDGAVFAGWSDSPVYDPNDPSASFFHPGAQTDEVYHANADEPSTLYAVWKVDVRFHLNKTSDASFGAAWAGYLQNGSVRSGWAYLGAPLAMPEPAPAYTGAADLMFRDWRTSAHADNAAADDSDVYDFSQPVTGALDLYAYWTGPVSLPIHFVNASGAALAQDDSVLLTPALSVLDTPVSLGAADVGSYLTMPSGYTLAFAALNDPAEGLQAINENNAVSSIRYSAEDGCLVATLADGSGTMTVPSWKELYFVCYELRGLPVGYLAAANDGSLSPVSGVSAAAPSATALLGDLTASDLLSSPLAWESSGAYSGYAYAIGSASAARISDLTLLTGYSDSDSAPPALQVRNTWRCFEYSVDGGGTWTECDDAPTLYVVYFPSEPHIVTIREETEGLAGDLAQTFTFSLNVTDADSNELLSDTHTLESGESVFLALYDGQTIVVTQTLDPTFALGIEEADGLGSADASAGTWTWTADGSDDPVVTFVNSRPSLPVEVHVALVDVSSGEIVLRDDLRSSDPADYSFEITLGEEAALAAKLPPEALFTGSGADYAFGTAFYGSGSSPVTVGELGIASVAFAQGYDGAWSLTLIDDTGYPRTPSGAYQIYYLYYPKPQIRYVEETEGGVLTDIAGSGGQVTYSGEVMTLNGVTVVQDQSIVIPPDGLTIAQSSGSFRMPPMLDKGANQLYLVFSKIGAGDASAAQIDSIGSSEAQRLEIRIIANKLQWSFDSVNWTPFTGTPTVYAIYRERGYDLTITKTVPVDTGYHEPFTVTVSSTAINRSSYAVEGTGSSTISAEVGTGSEAGRITFTVIDGSSVKLIGLPAGSYTITESDHTNYTLSAQFASGGGELADVAVTDNSSVTIALETEAAVALTNTPDYICQVGTRKFHTISDAVTWIEENASDFSGTIEMLKDYLMPASDSVEIADYLDITLTSAEGGDYTITRKENFTSEAMITNSGTFTVTGVTLDGGSAAGEHAMIENEGALTIADGASLQNADGGAVNSWAGSVSVTGGSISGNSASRGAALNVTGGIVAVSGGTITGNTADQGGAIYYDGGETVSVSGGSISGNSASEGGAIYMNTGTLSVSGGSMASNTASGNGGAICGASAVVELYGGTIGGTGADDGNTAGGSGGAVYVDGGSVVVVDALLQNNAAGADGGAIASRTGSVSVVSGTITENHASGNGGAVASDSGTVVVTGGTLSSNSARNGGAVYAQSGAVTLTGTVSGSVYGTVFSGNTASVGGGAVYALSGAVTASAVSFTGNTAGENGGALLAQSGSASITNASFTSNSAVNGAAVYVDTGSASFSGSTVSGNTATNGGAVGVGSSASRLTFSGNVRIIDNTMAGAKSNVYLDQDSDAVINAAGLGGSASVGIYVAGDTDADLFMNRGVPSALFGTYTSTSNVGKFSNDRLTGLSVQMETASKKLYWGKPFQVEVRYLESYAGGFPPTAAGSTVYTSNSYYAPAGRNAASEIAASLQSKVSSTTAVFANAFVQGASSFGDYVTDVNWDSGASAWKFTKRDGTAVTGSKLIIYFSEPSYISIENNTDRALTVSALSVLGQSVINSASSAGYGYVFAVNGAIQSKLYPITASDLTLAAGRSVKLLFPGGKNAAYSLTGSFDGTGDVSYTMTGRTDPYTLASADAGSFSLPISGQPSTLPNTTGGTLEIIFGGSKAICRIVTDEINGVTDGEIAGKTEPDGDGKVEYIFSTLNQAVAFIKKYGLTTAAVEMLVDYLIPGSDVVSLPAGYDITFGTARDGQYQYPGTDADRRATISRDQGNNSSFISSESGTLSGGDYNTRLTVKDLIFDGKNFGGSSISGGIVKTKGCNVVIDNCDFNNCVARFGGGIYIESVNKSNSNKTPYGSLTVTNSNFTGCQSLHSEDKYGGGAIWTSMKDLTVSGCSFNNCVAVRQAGAVFHYVGGNYTTSSTVTSCSFEGCRAQAAGSLESGAKTVLVRDCTFRNSTATERNGGAVNVWALDSDKTTVECHVTLDSCTFENCYALNGTGTNGNGGAMRSTATYNEIINCSFNNATGNNGGAINIYNANAVDTVVSGCDFSSCSARDQGGAVYCMSKTLSVTGTDNTMQNCTAVNSGGGVFHGRDVSGSAFTLSGMNVENCGSEKKAGGGVYSSAQTISVSDCMVTGCTAPQQGGGLCFMPIKTVYSPRSLTVADTEISGNSATGDGGGLYFYFASGNGTMSVSGSTIARNASGGMGGGICTSADNVTLSAVEISDNAATGNGGGICHNKNSANYTLTAKDGCTITGNSSGGMGGGIYTLANLAFQNATVTGNSLKTNTVGNAAGVYMANSRTLTIGTEGSTEADHTTITDNKTDNGTLSDLRLPVSGSVNSNSVTVHCDLDGEIRVLNANKKGTQFGVSTPARPKGFSDLGYVFRADDDSLYGIIDRQDETGHKIIWAGDPICKITDENGRLLFLDDRHASPAVFDYLDRGNSQNPNMTSAFGILRYADPPLYNADGTLYTGSAYQVKMLVENYTADSRIFTPNNSAKSVTLTTAGSNDSLYPYRGRAGTRSTILRGSHNYAMLTARSNLTVTNIVLDSGSESGAPSGADSRILLAETAGTTIRLGKNATLQNAKVTGTSNGGAVRLNNASAALIIEGGSIRNCTSPQSGGAIHVRYGSLTMTGGSITRGTAGDRGGGVYQENGSFTMTGGSITRSTAKSGGGVYVPNSTSYPFTMTGGSISNNSATVAGGGIAVAGKNSRIYFQGAPYVFGNTMNGAACNLQMDQGFNYNHDWQQADAPATVITSRGLIRGATIGVYVPGSDDENSNSTYINHGVEATPFGIYDGSTQGLHYFINDRNGLKGGLMGDDAIPQPGSNIKIYWRQIYSLEVTKQVLSDDPADAEKTFKFTIRLSGVAGAGLSSYPASEFTGLYGDLTFVNGVAQFNLKSGETKIADLMPLGFDYTVTEDLSDEDQAYFKTLPGLVQRGSMNLQSTYVYEVEFTNLHAVCKLTEGGELLYYLMDGVYRPAVYSKLVNAFNALKTQTFYTREGDQYNLSSVNTAATHVEMLIPDYELEQTATFQAGTRAILTTADPNADDGFPYIGSGTAPITRAFNGESMITVKGDLTLGNITLDGNKEHGWLATEDGGALYVESGGALTMGTGASVVNARTTENGAGVYVSEGAKLYLSGAPVFSGNVANTPSLVSELNGGESVYSGGTARQDVYLAGYAEENAASIVVTGNLTSGEGSIWVWAEEGLHAEERKQFAIMQGGVRSGLNAFRNARTDTDTKNTTGTWLFGVTHEGDSQNVYWSGASLIVTKTITGSFADLTDTFDFTVSGLTAGRSYDFTRYTSTDGSTWTPATGAGASGKLTANSSGKVTFTLGHHQRIDISLPYWINVTVSEVYGRYAPSYQIGTNAVVEGNTTTSIRINGDKTAAFTNSCEPVSPTGLRFGCEPWRVILAAGAALALLHLLGRERRREEDS